MDDTGSHPLPTKNRPADVLGGRADSVWSSLVAREGGQGRALDELWRYVQAKAALKREKKSAAVTG